MTMTIFTEQIVEVLNACNNVEDLYLAINKIYQEIQVAQPWLESISIGRDETHNFVEPYYYCPDTMSEDCITLRLEGEYSFIYKNYGEWILDDEWSKYSEINKNQFIAKSLMSWECLSLPSKVVEIKKLILDGYWIFDANIVPKLSSDIPKDTRELINWDDKCVLTATTKDNMCVISREEWNIIITNENKFL